MLGHLNMNRGKGGVSESKSENSDNLLLHRFQIETAGPHSNARVV